MNGELIDKLIKEPLGWVGAVVMMFIVAHTITTILKATRSKNRLVIILEVIVTLTLSVVILHEYLSPHHSNATAEHVSFFNSPVFLFILLILFSIISAIIYIIYRKVIGMDKEGE